MWTALGRPSLPLVFHGSLKLHLRNFLSCLLLTWVFLSQEVGEVLSPLYFHHRVEDTRGMIDLAPFPPPWSAVVGLLPPFVCSVPGSVYGHHEENHCYIIYDNYFSKINHGLLSHSWIYSRHFVGLRLTILDSLGIYTLKVMLKKKKRTFYLLYLPFPPHFQSCVSVQWV